MTVNSLELACRSHVGLVRENNEDSYTADEDYGLLVVADGMGGHCSGEVASRIAVETAAEELGNAQHEDLADELDSLMVAGNAIERANQAIFAEVERHPEQAGMGTTVVTALFRDNRIYYAHVGDSRLYRFRNGHLHRLTRDHSLVQHLLDEGLFRDRAEAREAGVGDNVLTRCLGQDPNVEVDVGDADLEAGDLFLCCTDGLTGMVDDARIKMLLSADESLEVIASRLEAAALAGGGVDNVTLVLARPLLNRAA
jgi:serine/threonine protein phosphatase PrpC